MCGIVCARQYVCWEEKLEQVPSAWWTTFLCSWMSSRSDLVKHLCKMHLDGQVCAQRHDLIGILCLVQDLFWHFDMFDSVNQIKQGLFSHKQTSCLLTLTTTMLLSASWKYRSTVSTFISVLVNEAPWSLTNRKASKMILGSYFWNTCLAFGGRTTFNLLHNCEQGIIL